MASWLLKTEFIGGGEANPDELVRVLRKRIRWALVKLGKGIDAKFESS